jgi:hypothetical protein
MADSRVEVVGGLRVSQAAFDADRFTFTITGALEFGRVPDGVDVRLPLPGGDSFYASIVAVKDLDSSPGITRIAVSVLAVEVGRERLEKLNIAGEQLQLVRRTFEPSHHAGQPSGPDRIRADDFLRTVETVGISIVGIMGLLILAAAIFVPPLLGDRVNGTVVAWMIAAVAAFLGAVVLVNADRRWSLPVLMFACVFFFVSCGSNLKLHLD